MTPATDPVKVILRESSVNSGANAKTSVSGSAVLMTVPLLAVCMYNCFVKLSLLTLTFSKMCVVFYFRKILPQLYLRLTTSSLQ